MSTNEGPAAWTDANAQKPMRPAAAFLTTSFIYPPPPVPWAAAAPLGSASNSPPIRVPSPSGASRQTPGWTRSAEAVRKTSLSRLAASILWLDSAPHWRTEEPEFPKRVSLEATPVLSHHLALALASDRRSHRQSARCCGPAVRANRDSNQPRDNRRIGRQLRASADMPVDPEVLGGLPNGLRYIRPNPRPARQVDSGWSSRPGRSWKTTTSAAWRTLSSTCSSRARSTSPDRA